MRAAETIVRALEAQGLSRVYCVPGESYLTLLDALHDSNAIETVICRHESGAGFMAVAEAKLTGKPACFMVSRGPGATNGSIAVHVAEQDAVPVVVLIGQVSREERGRGAFQEVDYGQFFGKIAKGVFEVTEGQKLPETMARAFHLAQTGVPGPVIVVMPEDMLADEVTGPLPDAYPVTKPAAARSDVDRFLALLAKSERPLIIAGARLRGIEGAAALKAFAERHHVPVAASWKNQDVFDNASPLYAGHLGFGNPAKHKELLAKSDLVIAIGTRLGDIASQNFTFPQAPVPKQPLVHVYPDTAPIGRVFRTELGIVADPSEFLALATKGAPAHAAARERWAGEIRAFIDGFMAFKSPAPQDGVDFGEVVMAIARNAPKDAIVTTDAGNFSSWVHRHWRLSTANTMLGAIAGAMGFGVPAAVGAALSDGKRTPIAFVGDGGVLMTGQELATAMQYGGKPKIVISDNGTYGTIRTHQEKRFPGRVVGTHLKNPDLTKWAQSFGAHVETIARGDDIDAKVKRAFDHDGAAVIVVKSSQEALSAFTTLSALRGT
ncbi:MAG: thiamine pyrophosphate-binding protein [Hyphomicrobiales bacterium]